MSEFKPGDIVKIGAGFVDWEVVDPAYGMGFVLLKSGMSGRRCKVHEAQLKVWKSRA